MGFYGNITNVNKTNFVFDKIYNNKLTMDYSCETDGVFVGRYVLIEYDMNLDTLYREAIIDKNGYLSFRLKNNETTRIRYSETDTSDELTVFKGEIIFVTDANTKKVTFYQCIGKVNGTSSDGIIYADFKEIVTASSEVDVYLQNFLIDSDNGNKNIGKGYDSTVWQKIFVNNKAKYVNIAELNSVVPSFNLTVDAPTDEPIVPHFDADTTNVNYNLHVQPSWGFRIKNAKEDTVNSDEKTYPSNVDVKYTVDIYDPKTKTSKTEERDYKGAIYYNSEGFNPGTRFYEENVKDIFTVQPTGKSQTPYNIHDKLNPTKTGIKEDIQELVVMLPSIGNAISDMWDIVYNKPNNGEDRNTVIKWGSTQGVRMVNATDDGYSYEPDKIKTLAGAINSVHDLMGMIIDDKYQNEIVDIDKEHEHYEDLVQNALTLLQQADANKIYYINNKFYMKAKSYDWEEYNGNNQYKEIILANTYDGHNYYHKTINNDYELSLTPVPIDGVIYYKIEMLPLLLDPPYEINKYYYIDENNNYLIDQSELAVKDRQYYKTLDVQLENTQTKTNTGTNLNTYFFIQQQHAEIGDGIYKGLFYIYTDEDGYEIEMPCDETTEFKCEDVANKRPFIGEYTKSKEYDVDTGEIVTVYSFISQEYINLIEWNPEKQYFIEGENNNGYTYIKNLPDFYYIEPVNYYTIIIPEGSAVVDFYKKDIYYYTTPEDDKNYRFGSDDYNKDFNYYKLILEEKYDAFYEPNKYYYLKEDNYILDSSESKQDYQYYDYSEIYVHPDSKNPKFIPYSLWNPNLKASSFEDLKLGCRFDSWRWKELEGFAKNINTIHGLILEVNNILQNDDIETRESDTVQGCINTLNDIIHKINYLKPAEFMIVDECGMMTSSPWTTEQTFNSYNYGTGNATNDVKKENAWIELNVDDDHDSPMITIKHNYNPVGITTTISDKNTGIKKENAGINNNTNDTIKLYTPIVDNMGHIVGDNTEVVTLPFGYKSFKDSEENPGQTDAKTTQSIMTLIGDNWIKPTVSAQDTLKYEHIGPVKTNETKADDADKTPQFGDAFTIEDWYFDEKGHKSNRLTHTITIPKGSLTDNNKSGSDIITQLSFDEPTGALSTIRENLSSIKLAGYVKNEEDKADIAAEDTLGQALSKLQVQILEEETARAAIIDALDMSDENNAFFISKITQTNGQVAVERAAAGTLVLSDSTENIATQNALRILGSDSIETAFGKVEAQIVKENTDRVAAINSINEALNLLNGDASTVGSVANTTATEIAKVVNDNNNGSIDTLNEIAAWIINDTTGAAKMNADIGINTTNIALNTSAIELLETSTVSIATYEAKIAELEQEILTVNSRCNVLDKEVKNLINKVAELEAKLNS